MLYLEGSVWNRSTATRGGGWLRVMPLSHPWDRWTARLGTGAARPWLATIELQCPLEVLSSRMAERNGGGEAYLAAGLATLTERIWGNTYGRTCQDFPALGLMNSWPVVVPT